MSGRARMCAALMVLVTACGSGDTEGVDVGAAASATTGQAAAAEADADAACADLKAFVAARTEIDGDDLASLRRGFATLETITADLAESAPADVSEAAADLHEWAIEVRETVDDPGYEIDPDTLVMWDTPQAGAAQQALGEWAEGRCGDLNADARPDVMIVVCLGPQASDADFDQVNPRLQLPTGRGSEVELPPGVGGVSWDYVNGEIHVTLDRFVTPEERAQLEAALRAAPVLGLVEVEVPYSGRSESSSGPTEGCPSG